MHNDCHEEVTVNHTALDVARRPLGRNIKWLVDPHIVDFSSIFLIVTICGSPVKMKFSAITAILPALASAAYFAQEEYESGAVMEKMMERKEVSCLATAIHS